ncbi:MAG: hypothetical protein KC505_08940 [Myxococcales bacterium]|nr:hypothetical protein [Myxococcales bacterium]USN49944.1 MAG: hypothetical protein H6731_06605 [Myxococcales bacterium]
MSKRKVLSYAIKLIALFSWVGCTSAPVKVPPPDHSVPFPLHMALEGDALLVVGANTDDHFSDGKLVVIDTTAVDRVIKSGVPKNPIAWNSVVTSNVLIPSASSMIALDSNTVTFASDSSSRLYRFSIRSGVLSCENAQKSIVDCKDTQSLSLKQSEPGYLQLIATNNNEKNLLISYRTSSQIELISLGTKMKHVRSFNFVDTLKSKNIKISADEIIVTKKIQVEKNNEKSLVYFLLERQFKEDKSQPQGIYLLSINLSDLLNNEKISPSRVNFWDFKDKFFIDSAHDMHIDEAEQSVYILAEKPESIFKFSLKSKTLLDTTSVCESATSMSVSKEQNRIFIPCYKDSRIASFTKSPLSLDVVSEIHGQGPAKAVLDEKKKLIYVSFFDDGTLGIFDFNLKYLGKVFSTTSPDGIGL